MATAIGTEDIKGAGNPLCAWPALDSVEDAVRTARRAVHVARNATEDFVKGTELEVRRHPAAALGLAATAGLMTGVALGLAGAWFWTNR